MRKYESLGGFHLVFPGGKCGTPRETARLYRLFATRERKIGWTEECNYINPRSIAAQEVRHPDRR